VDEVHVEISGPVMHVTLCRPEQRNAQTPATWRALAAAGAAVSDDVRLVILRAEGPSFSAGLDRAMLTPEGVPGEESLLSLMSDTDEALEGFISDAQAGFTWWHDVDAMTVAIVNGHAIGAGMQLALACDVIIAGPQAQFAMRETSLGLVPDLAGTSPLVQRVGFNRALEICATGRLVSAEEAFRIGLVENLADDPDAAAQALSETLLATPAGALRALKPLLRHAVKAAPEDQRAAERVAQIARLRSINTV
jgi:enoyl-CoA hydratase/carnithine racemase